MLRSAVLLALLVLAGCRDESGNFLPAFYLAQGPDVRGEAGGEDLSQYGLVVGNTDLNAGELILAAPKAIVLAYWDSRWIAAPPAEGGWGGPGSVQDRKRAYFLENDYLRAPDGARLSVWPGTWELNYTKENAATLARAAANLVRGWHGIYLDDLHVALPDTVRRALGWEKGPSWQQLQSDWIVYRDALVEELRSYGFEILVGNVGPPAGGVSMPEVNGFCMEEHWPEARGAFISHVVDPGVSPALCVAWEWDAGGVIRTGKIRYRKKYLESPAQ